MITVHVNGEEQQLRAGTTVRQLLSSLGLDRDGIAVAIDRKVVPRSQHGTHQIEEGASVEVIRAVGGG